MKRIGRHKAAPAGTGDAEAAQKPVATQKKPGPIARVKQLAITISLLTVAGAQLDIRHRPADTIRGPKWLWRLLCLNVTGVFAYLRWGRRPAKQDG